MMKRLLTVLGPLAALLAVAEPAAAHGVQGRAETPIPVSAFLWAAVIVLVVSFAALALGWSRARLTRVPWRPLPVAVSDALLSPAVTLAARLVVLAATLFITAAAAFGSARLNENIAPVAIFVVWWVGLVPVSVLFGNAWRQLNPWATLARLTGAPAHGARALPRWLGLWPAAGFLVTWGWLELVYPTPSEPRLIAALIVCYSFLSVAAMHRYGVERWLAHGEVFSVYTATLALLSPIETREVDGRARLGLRPPVVAVTQLRRQPAQVAFVGALIATVTFDGLSGSEFWTQRDVAAAERLINLGIGDFTAGLIVATIGLAVTVAVVIGAYELASAASARWSHWREARPGRAAAAFAHALIPIALAYFVAHYFTLFVFQSQDVVRLISDPFGTGADLFGTADYRIDFQLVSANLIWAVQVGAIVVGHVVGLALAHDRALALNIGHRAAIRSQYPMLALMVAFTVAGLWSLSEGMATA